MKTQSPDTDPKAEKVLIELIRKAPVWRRLEMVSDLVKTGRTFSMIGLESRYPHASEEELRRRMAALWLDREIVIKVYGWDPEIEGY
ncbi:MAG: hypothetical protein QME81_09285 [bacterium]|nr:hypothetical protein [bacterium]